MSQNETAIQPRKLFCLKDYVWVFLLFWSFFCLTNSGVDESEGTQHFSLAERFVETGKLSFSQDQYWKGFMKGPDGQFYCAHEIGNTLFVLPEAVVSVGLKHVLHEKYSEPTLRRLIGFLLSFVAPTYAALTCMLFFLILRNSCQQSIAHSLLGTYLLALTTFLWTYSRILFDGVLAGTLLLGSFFFLTQYLKQNSLRNLIGCFALLGFSIITRLTLVFGLISTVVCILLSKETKQTKIKHLAIGCSVLIPFAIWQMGYNWIRSGSIFVSPVMKINSWGCILRDALDSCSALERAYLSMLH